jgi:GNAT superfamily N-acetyltransferase
MRSSSPTVDPGFRRQGIGRELIRRAAEASRSRGAQWLHVDYEADLEPFYTTVWFRSTAAGVMQLVTNAQD